MAELTDDFLWDLSEDLGAGWQKVGFKLGMGQADIDRAKANHQFDMTIQAQSLLIQWRKQTPSEHNKRELLATALKKAGYIEIAEKHGLIAAPYQQPTTTTTTYQPHPQPQPQPQPYRYPYQANNPNQANNPYQQQQAHPYQQPQSTALYQQQPQSAAGGDPAREQAESVVLKLLDNLQEGEVKRLKSCMEISGDGVGRIAGILQRAGNNVDLAKLMVQHVPIGELWDCLSRALCYIGRADIAERGHLYQLRPHLVRPVVTTHPPPQLPGRRISEPCIAGRNDSGHPPPIDRVATKIQGPNFTKVPKLTTQEPATGAVLLVGDEWGTSKGGISTMNRDISKLLRSANFEVFATVLKATEEEKQDAESIGIQLVCPHEDADGEDAKKKWLEKPALYFPHLKDIAAGITIVVGHCLVLAKASVKIRDFIKKDNSAVKLYMFNHVTTDIELYKKNATPMSMEKKRRQILDAASKADKIFSVGPEIFNHCADLYKADDSTMEKDHSVFLPKPAPIFFDQFKGKGVPKSTGSGSKTVLWFGRVSEVDKLKGCDIAARAMGIVTELRKKVHQNIPNWEVRGIAEDNWKEELEKLQSSANSLYLKPKVYIYSTQKDVIAQLRRCHLVLMTSRTEPFGLVGLEAMALGIPTLVNWNTGLAKFIKEHLPGFDFFIVEDTSVLDDEDSLEHDAKLWSDKILDVLQKHDMWIDWAAQLKEALKNCPAIEESREFFLEKCQLNK